MSPSSILSARPQDSQRLVLREEAPFWQKISPMTIAGVTIAGHFLINNVPVIISSVVCPSSESLMGYCSESSSLISNSILFGGLAVALVLGRKQNGNLIRKINEKCYELQQNYIAAKVAGVAALSIASSVVSGGWVSMPTALITGALCIYSNAQGRGTGKIEGRIQGRQAQMDDEKTRLEGRYASTVAKLKGEKGALEIRLEGKKGGIAGLKEQLQINAQENAQHCRDATQAMHESLAQGAVRAVTSSTQSGDDNITEAFQRLERENAESSQILNMGIAQTERQSPAIVKQIWENWKLMTVEQIVEDMTKIVANLKAQAQAQAQATGNNGQS